MLKKRKQHSGVELLNSQYLGDDGEVGEVGENLGEEGENCAGARAESEMNGR